MKTTCDLSVWDAREMKWITFMVSPTQKDCVEFHYCDTGENSVDDYVEIVYKSHVTGYCGGYLTVPCNGDKPEYTFRTNQVYGYHVTEARKIWNWLLIPCGWKPEKGRVSGF